MEIDDWLTDFDNRMAELQKRSETLTENLEAASGTASSPDGAVTVEIGPNGALQRIEFGKEVSDHTPTQLGSLVMKTVRHAQRRVAERVTDAMNGFGVDDETLRRFIAYQPPLDEEERSELERDNSEFGMAAEPEQEQAAAPEPAASTAAPRSRAPRTADEEVEEEADNDPW